MEKADREKSSPHDCPYKLLKKQIINIPPSDQNDVKQYKSQWKQDYSKTFIITLSLGLIVVGVVLLTCILYTSFNHIPTISVVHTFATNSKFVSLGLDSSVIADGFKNFDMKSTRLKNMIKNLSPGYLRVGGTLADRLEFVIDAVHLSKKPNDINIQDGDVCAYEDEVCALPVKSNFTMSGKEWLLLNDFASKSGFSILFDLNALMRNDDGSWNYTNAEKLIDFSNSNNLDVIWELGNEPNSFKHVFNYEVNATQMAKDFRILRQVLNKYPKYKDSMLLGPDVTRPRPENKESVIYMKTFLTNAGESIDAITWHQYYFNGRTASFQDFINPNVFDLLINQANTINDLIKSIGLQNKQIWIGETAAAYGGGAPGYTNRYIGTFIWLDKLGVAAKLGIDVVVRQSIFKGFYALIDKDYEPTPDYWVSVLYKNLVRPEIVPCFENLPEKVRMYCQCASTSYMDSSIVVYGMNMKNTSFNIEFKDIPGLHDIDDTKIFAFILTSKGTLYSKNIYLNNKMLQLNSNGDLPLLQPVIIKGKFATMPQYSTAFFVIPINVAICHKK